MKNKFFEHHRYTKEQFDLLTNTAIFILDTNVLLHFYRYNQSNRNKLFEVLEKVESRLWLPYQVASEFYKNRIKLIKNKATFINKLKQEIEKQLNIKLLIDNSEDNSPYFFLKFEKELNEGMLSIFNNNKNDIIKILDTYENDIKIEYLIERNDPILEQLANIYKNKVNDKIDEDKRNELYAKGKERYLSKIPPGYEDMKTKPEPDYYGDYIIWEEILEYSKHNQKNVVFITDDKKEDWWEIINGMKAGPRSELIREFNTYTSSIFYMYTTERFINLISTKYDVRDIESLEQETKNIVNYLEDSKIKMNIRFDQFGSEQQAIEEVREKETQLNSKYRKRYDEYRSRNIAHIREESLFRWLIKKYPESSFEHREYGFPDYIIIDNNNERIGIEITYSPRINTILPRIWEKIYQGYSEIGQNRLDVFVIVLLTDDEESANELSRYIQRIKKDMPPIIIQFGYVNDDYIFIETNEIKY